tara:strand:- start:32709 stop:33293 length:585 start_codon:yes stop_codon:yes gene_type:complete
MVILQYYNKAPTKNRPGQKKENFIKMKVRLFTRLLHQKPKSFIGLVDGFHPQILRTKEVHQRLKQSVTFYKEFDISIAQANIEHVKIPDKGRHHPDIVGRAKIDISSVVFESRWHPLCESIHGNSLRERKGAQKSIQIKGFEWIGAELETMALEVNAMVLHPSGSKGDLEGCPSKMSGPGGLAHYPDFFFGGLQ